MITYTPTPDYYNDYLAHYGVMGMKWGIRKNPAKAYIKAYNKHKKLEEKAENYLTKDILKMRRKKASKIKLSRRTKRATNKMIKWDDKARKAFANTSYLKNYWESPYMQINPNHFVITKQKKKK